MRRVLSFGSEERLIAVDDSYTIPEDTPLSAALLPSPLAEAATVETVDGAPGSDEASAVLVGGPFHGTLALNPNGSFLYTPALNYSGIDSFTYRGGEAPSDAPATVVTVVIMVTPVAESPAHVTGAGEVPLGGRAMASFHFSVRRQTPRRSGDGSA